MLKIKNAIEERERFLEQDRSTTVNLSGIAEERFNGLINGDKATAEEIVNISKALRLSERETLCLLVNAENHFTMKDVITFVENNDADKLLDLYIQDRFIKADGKLYFIAFGHNAKKISDEVTLKIVKCFYDNGIVEIAAALSTANAYIRFDSVKNELENNGSKVLKYLFGSENMDSPYFDTCSWFKSLFDGCDKDDKNFLVKKVAERFNAVLRQISSDAADRVSVEKGFVFISKGYHTYAYNLPQYELLALSAEQKAILDGVSKAINIQQ